MNTYCNPTPVAPTVSLNGTSKDALVKDLMDTVECLRSALRYLAGCAPHSRDYLQGRHDGLRGEVALSLAQGAHSKRTNMIEAVVMELCTMASEVEGQRR